MATLTPVVVPAKVLKGGKHKVRIALAHNGETRYILTSIILDSDKEFKNGQVVKRPDAAMKNTLLRAELQKYQQAIDKLPYIEGLTCAELIYQMKNSDRYRHRTCQSIFEEYIENSSAQPSTTSQYRVNWNAIAKYINGNMLMENVTHATVLGLDKYFRSQNLKSSTIADRMTFFRVLSLYAVRCGYVQYRINPFMGYHTPEKQARDSWLTVEDICTIRDFQPSNSKMKKCQDFFMLSYYLGGINIIDMLKINFNESPDFLSYVRAKTERRAKMNKFVEFEIPEEAKPIIERLKGPDGRIKANKYQAKDNYHAFLTYYMPKLAKATGIKNLIYYSARKSFSQHAFNLGISTSVIDYILGHKLDKGGSSLYSYISVTPEMATKAIRQVIDNLNQHKIGK